MKAFKMPIRYRSSRYKEESVQVSSFTCSTLMFLVLKACLMQMLYCIFVCLVSLCGCGCVGVCVCVCLIELYCAALSFIISFESSIKMTVARL